MNDYDTITDYDHLMIMYATWGETVEDIKENDDSILSIIENADPEYQLPMTEFLEEALLELKPLMTKSDFVEKNSRALNLYHKIIKEHGFESKV